MTYHERMEPDAWWDRLWATQLVRIHLHHVADKQKLRRRIRDVEEALRWANQVIAEQTRLRLEAQAREVMAAHVAAEVGLEAMAGWLQAGKVNDDEG